MKDNQKSDISGVFTNLVKFMKPSEIKSEDDKYFEFSFGNLTLKQIDSQKDISWNYISYSFKKKFDFDRLIEICKDEDYLVSNSNPISKELSINMKEEDEVSLTLNFKNDNYYEEMRFAQGHYLDDEFFDKIPTDDWIKIFTPALCMEKEK